MLQRATLPFSKAPSLYAANTLPSLSDWQALWSAWDMVTKGMLPKQELTEKPIKLRNACIFYLGHIPTFLDIQLTKTTSLAPTEPASYHAIFERGVDPDVDNPEKCHEHSVIPDEWPPVDDITAYQGRVRARLTSLYEKGVDTMPRDMARAIWVGFEHEVMHIETLLYMMLQSDRTLPPPHMGIPDFERMAKKALEARVPNEWFDVPEQVITVGMNDPEDGKEDVHFGWYAAQFLCSFFFFLPSFLSSFPSNTPYPLSTELADDDHVDVYLEYPSRKATYCIIGTTRSQREMSRFTRFRRRADPSPMKR